MIPKDGVDREEVDQINSTVEPLITHTLPWMALSMGLRGYAKNSL